MKKPQSKYKCMRPQRPFVKPFIQIQYMFEVRKSFAIKSVTKGKTLHNGIKFC